MILFVFSACVVSSMQNLPLNAVMSKSVLTVRMPPYYAMYHVKPSVFMRKYSMICSTGPHTRFVLIACSVNVYIKNVYEVSNFTSMYINV